MCQEFSVLEKKFLSRERVALPLKSPSRALWLLCSSRVESKSGQGATPKMADLELMEFCSKRNEREEDLEGIPKFEYFC